MLVHGGLGVAHSRFLEGCVDQYQGGEGHHGHGQPTSAVFAAFPRGNQRQTAEQQHGRDARTHGGLGQGHVGRVEDEEVGGHQQ